MTGNNDDKLKIVLTEYKLLMEEARERIKSQLQIYPIVLSAISIVFGYIIVNEKYDALFLVPFFTITLIYRWMWDVKMTDICRTYLTKIEKDKLPKLISSFEKNGEQYEALLGWHRYYEKQRPKQEKLWLYSAILLLGVPTLISIFYYIYFLYHAWTDINSINLLLQFPYGIYLLATIVYAILSIHIVFRGCKMLRERENSRRIENTNRKPT